MIFITGDIVFLCVCFGIHVVYRYRRRNILPTPPGLPKWPILGNALSMSLNYAHLVYRDLGKRKGVKMLYLEAVGQPLLVINDYHVAVDLLEKRSALYSSRAKINHFFGFMPYGDEWRNHRRLFQEYFSVKNLPREQEKTLEFIRKGLLPCLYTSPKDFRDHLRNIVGGFATSITYGLPVQRQHDPLVKEADEILVATITSANPGTYLVNIIPQLQYVPEWMPGTEFKRVARQLRTRLIQLMEVPFQATVRAMDAGEVVPSFVSGLMEKYRRTPEFELHALRIKQAATQISGAVTETTSSAVLTFILAMLNYPHVQRRAQREIDLVVEKDNLPEFSDLPRPTYLSAIIKEVLRWGPVLPLGLPHMTSDEDVYEGYYIPKDCIVLANAYAMLHDEETFPNPNEFDPERFIQKGRLREDILDPETMCTFGFGRRKCPGAHIGLAATYIAAASILHLFDISPEVDENGSSTRVTPRSFSGDSAVSLPLPFKCKITPRKDRNLDTLLGEYIGTEPI